MSRLIFINGDIKTDGSLTVSQRIIENEEGKKELLIEGVLVCEDYFEEINEIETIYAAIEDVFVYQEILENEKALIWYPAEVNTSIRPGWFWHESENDMVRSLDELINIYYNSVGGNATFLLNIPPTKDGLFHENDVQRLCEMGEYEAADSRIKERYEDMVNKDYSTLWEFWNSWQGTMNHAWSGGPLVIMSKHFAGIAPIEAGYEKVKIDPQYALSDTLSCTVPSVKGLITLNYEKTSDNYIINVTLPENMKTVLYIPEGAEVSINSELYYQNGEYINESSADSVEIVEKSLSN